MNSKSSYSLSISTSPCHNIFRNGVKENEEILIEYLIRVRNVDRICSDTVWPYSALISNLKKC